MTTIYAHDGWDRINWFRDSMLPMWAVGCIICELYSGDCLFAGMKWEGRRIWELSSIWREFKEFRGKYHSGCSQILIKRLVNWLLSAHWGIDRQKSERMNFAKIKKWWNGFRRCWILRFWVFLLNWVIGYYWWTISRINWLIEEIAHYWSLSKNFSRRSFETPLFRG